MGNVYDLMADYVRKRSALATAGLEQVCEEAIQGGEYGVMVFYLSNGTVAAHVCSNVPYGHIHETRCG